MNSSRQQEKLNMGLNHALTCCGKKLRSWTLIWMGVRCMWLIGELSVGNSERLQQPDKIPQHSGNCGRRVREQTKMEEAHCHSAMTWGFAKSPMGSYACWFIHILPFSLKLIKDFMNLHFMKRWNWTVCFVVGVRASYHWEILNYIQCLKEVNIKNFKVPHYNSSIYWLKIIFEKLFF